MANWFEEIGTQLGALPPGRQLVLGIAALGSLAFFGWITLGATTPEYRALFGHGADGALALYSHQHDHSHDHDHDHDHPHPHA